MPSPRNFSKKLFTIKQLANALFTKIFQDNETFGQKLGLYWTEIRRLSLETGSKRGIGLCKNDKKFIIDILLRHKLPVSAIRQSGLFYFKDEVNLSAFRLRFRLRLTIPIRDIQRKIVGFSARTIDGITPEASDAKYINSPEKPIFVKEICYSDSMKPYYISRPLASFGWLKDSSMSFAAGKCEC
jgi:DNA primase